MPSWLSLSIGLSHHLDSVHLAYGRQAAVREEAELKRSLRQCFIVLLPIGSLITPNALGGGN
jgi:hypothetical protein